MQTNEVFLMVFGFWQMIRLVGGRGWRNASTIFPEVCLQGGRVRVCVCVCMCTTLPWHAVEAGA